MPTLTQEQINNYKRMGIPIPAGTTVYGSSQPVSTAPAKTTSTATPAPTSSQPTPTSTAPVKTFTQAPTIDYDAISKQIAEIQKKTQAIAQQVPTANSSPQINQNNVDEKINETQDTIANLLNSANQPATRSSSKTLNELMAEMNATIKSNITATKPEAPNLETEYTNLLTQYKITDLETSLNDLTAQETNLKAQFDAMVGNERDKPVAQSVIEGRISREARGVQEQMDKITAKKTQVQNELNTKYNVVNNIMSLKKTDYSNAVSEYESQFSQQMQVLTAVRGILNDEQSEEQQLANNARANANIIYNSIAAGTTDITDWSDSQTTLMTKLETQAGLPVGFYKTLEAKNKIVGNDFEVLSNPTRVEADGSKYADVITRNKITGQIDVQHVPLGQERLPGTKDEDDEEKNNQAIIDKFNKSLTDIKLYNYGKERDGQYKTREAFIKYLQMMYPQIDAGDIANAVYGYYPNR